MKRIIKVVVSVTLLLVALGGAAVGMLALLPAWELGWLGLMGMALSAGIVAWVMIIRMGEVFMDEHEGEQR